MRRPWIKVETSTPDKPEICAIATMLRMDTDSVLGKLIRLWSWVEVTRVPANDLGVTREFIDKLVGRKGFAAAMVSAGWLDEKEGKLAILNLDRHNGGLAKVRALTAQRVALHRKRKLARQTKDVSKPLPAEAPEPTPEPPAEVPSKPTRKPAAAAQSKPNPEPTAEVQTEPTPEPPAVHSESAPEPTAEIQAEPVPSVEVVEEVVPPSNSEPVAPTPTVTEKVTPIEEPQAIAAAPPAPPEAPPAPPPESEEAVVTEDPSPRKRRSRATVATVDQPMLF